jgi:hypothetical protein
MEAEDADEKLQMLAEENVETFGMTKPEIVRERILIVAIDDNRKAIAVASSIILLEQCLMQVRSLHMMDEDRVCVVVD